MCDFISVLGEDILYEYLVQSSNFTLIQSNILYEYINDIQSCNIEDFSNLSNIIGLYDDNYNVMINDLNVYGSNLYQISYNIGFIKPLTPQSAFNKYIIRYGDLKIEDQLTVNPLYDIWNVLYNIILTLTPVTEDTLFVIVGNMYPFPYEIIKFVTEGPAPLFFNNGPINIAERFDTSNITDIVEELRIIVSEHSVQLAVSSFQNTINPATQAQRLIKWTYRQLKELVTAPMSHQILNQIRTKIFPYGYIRQIDEIEDVVDSIVDGADNLFNKQRLVNTTTSTAITGLTSELQTISSIVLATAGLSIITGLFTFGNTLYNVLQVVKKNAEGKIIVLNRFNELIWYVFEEIPYNGLKLVNLMSSDYHSTIENTDQLVRRDGGVFKYHYTFFNTAQHNLTILDSNINIADWENNITISLRIKLNSISAQCPFIKIYDDSYTYLTAAINNNSYDLYIKSASGLIQTYFNFTDSYESVYKHIVFTISNNTILNQITTKLYIDKVLKNTTVDESVITEWYTINNNTIKIRFFENANDIEIDDFRIMLSTLNQEQINDLYNVYSPIKTIPELQIDIQANTNNISTLSDNITLIQSNITFIQNNIYSNIELTSNNLITYVNDKSDYLIEYNNLTSNNLLSNINVDSSIINNKIDSLWLNNTSTSVVYNLNSNICIGANSTSYKLDVRGITRSKDLIVKTTDKEYYEVLDAFYYLKEILRPDRFWVMDKIGLLDKGYYNYDNYYNRSPNPITNFNDDLNKYVCEYYNLLDYNSQPSNNILAWDNYDAFFNFLIGVNIKLDTIYINQQTYGYPQKCIECWLGGLIGSYKRYSVELQPMEYNTQILIKIYLYNSGGLVEIKQYLIDEDATQEHFWLITIANSYIFIYCDGEQINFGTQGMMNGSYGAVREIWIGANAGVDYNSKMIYSDVIIKKDIYIENFDEINDPITIYNNIKKINSQASTKLYGITYIEQANIGSFYQKNQKIYIHSGNSRPIFG